jgi:6-phosphogluconolactonase (cycloisomerase 2 family)
MMYVNNGGTTDANNIVVGCSTVGYVLNKADGSLAETEGSPFDVGSYPTNIAIDPLRRFAYISSFNTRQITCYKIDSDTGRLNPIGTPVSAGSGVSNLAVDPSGKYLYAVNGTGTYPAGSSVSAYAINQDTGSLTHIADSDTGFQPRGIGMDPTGRFVYVPVYLSSSGQDVDVFGITETGALEKLAVSFGAAQSVDIGVHGVAIHPKGKFLYLIFCNNTTGIAVQAFTLNTSTGGLVAGQAIRKYYLPTTDGGNSADVAEVDPTGRFLYICMYNKRKIAIYSINQTSGDLTSLSGSPFQLWPASPSEAPKAIGFDPDGKFAYIVTALTSKPSTGTLRSYSIDQETGALSAMGSSFSPGFNSCDIEVIGLP